MQGEAAKPELTAQRRLVFKSDEWWNLGIKGVRALEELAKQLRESSKTPLIVTLENGDVVYDSTNPGGLNLNAAFAQEIHKAAISRGQAKHHARVKETGIGSIGPPGPCGSCGHPVRKSGFTTTDRFKRLAEIESPKRHGHPHLGNRIVGDCTCSCTAKAYWAREKEKRPT